MGNLRERKSISPGELIEQANSKFVIKAGSTKNPEELANQLETDGYSGVMRYARVKNMRKAEDSLLACKHYRHNEHTESSAEAIAGYVYIIHGKRFQKKK